jgi:hypothetical protein
MTGIAEYSLQLKFRNPDGQESTEFEHAIPGPSDRPHIAPGLLALGTFAAIWCRHVMADVQKRKVPCNKCLNFEASFWNMFL